jgi:septal ring factor EnvC (AmiA/AmiB activator)
MRERHVPQQIDELLAEIRDLSRRLDDTSLDRAERERIEGRRDELRKAARTLEDERRHPASVAAEIALLEDRLAQIEASRIDAAWSEKHMHRTIQDPGAYRHAINRAIDEEHRDEVAAINERLARLRAIPLDTP